MKKFICLIFITNILIACGNNSRNIAQECQDVFDTIEATQITMATNSYVPASMAAEYKRQNDEFLSNFRKGLKKADYEKQVLSCQPMTKLLKDKLERLNNATSEAEVKQIFYGL